ncbi:MAG: DUF5009 domain-containing protein [Acidobacteria bacterium]|nr:DUF5009 domain-containing protein [Acidobacteriota bacterium]
MEQRREQRRLLSLDIFRGFILASMILVNNSGGWPDAYPQLLHAQWNGWTFTDIVFPSFVWIAGLSMTLSFARRTAEGAGRGALLGHTLRRAGLIFLIGLVLNGLPHLPWSTWRIPGVLQRIAICYAVGAAIFLYTRWRGQAWAAAGCLGLYVVLMQYAPVPGQGAGHWDPESNFGAYVDRLLLGGHLYENTVTWDPEGLVTTLPAITTLLLGVLAGHLVRAGLTPAAASAWLMTTGQGLIFLGLAWNPWIPINKNLWTPSFALFMAGISSTLFGICHWVVDGAGWTRWGRFFVAFGVNSIAGYVASELIEKAMGYTGLRQPVYGVAVQFLSPRNAALLYALLNVGAVYLLAAKLHRDQVFIRL